MKGVELHWNILREEGRVLKAAADILKINCKFVPQAYCAQTQALSSEFLIIQNIDDLKSIQSIIPLKQSLFGQSEQERLKVQQYLSLYNEHYKPHFRLSLFDLIAESDHLIRSQKMKEKRQLIEQKLKQFDKFIGQTSTIFLCGNDIRVVDLLFYFDACNLSYFGKNPSRYENVWRWFQAVYGMKQVKIVTHQWYAMAKQISPLFKSKRPKEPSASKL